MRSAPGRLTPDEHVLIHAAAGGVGLAAIQYAKHRGAIVIATAGSRGQARLPAPGRRRSCARFARSRLCRSRCARSPAAQGVDVVLNSLSGEAMERSLAVLKPFGRFLELGKRDFYLNRRIHLRPLRQNISYFAHRRRPAADPAARSGPRAAGRDRRRLLAAGTIRPLAHRLFPLCRDRRRVPADAGVGSYRQDRARARQPMPGVPAARAAGHAPRAATAPIWSPAGSTGSASRRRAGWSRTAPARSRCSAAAGSETPGCADADCRTRSGGRGGPRLSRAMSPTAARSARSSTQSARASRRCAAIVHAAAAIDDGLAADIDLAAIGPILRAKLGGALALDALTRDDPIELFLLFSSATTLLGAPGPGRLCRREPGARGARPAAPRRRPAGAGGRLGSDRGCRLPCRTAGDPRRAGAPAWRQADPGGAGARRPAGDARERLAGGRLRRDELERGAALSADPGLPAVLPRSVPRPAPSAADDSLAERLAALEPRGGAGPAEERRHRGSGADPAAACGRDRPAAPALASWAWIR